MTNQMTMLLKNQSILLLMRLKIKWTKPIPNWGIILNKFMAIFVDKIKFPKIEFLRSD